MPIHDIQSPPEVTATGQSSSTKLILRELSVESFHLCNTYCLANLNKTGTLAKSSQENMIHAYINMSRLPVVSRIQVEADQS